MPKKFYLFMLLCICFISLNAELTHITSSKMSQMERMVIRLDCPSTEDAHFFYSLGYDLASYHPDKYLDLVVDRHTFSLLLEQNPAWYITQTEAQLTDALHSSCKDIPGYRSYDTMLADLMSLQANYPHLMQVMDIGSGWGSIYAQTIPFYQSFDHRIWAVKLSEDVMADAPKPAFYFIGAHHAREPISMEVCMHILTYLLEYYDIDPEVSHILANYELWFVPLMNPDGHKIVIDQTDVWWRKNIRDNNGSHTFNTNYYLGYGYDGVDLNRNYGYYWGYQSCSDDPSSVIYHGSEAFSEPESQAVRDLLLSRQFIAGISYHTYGQMVLYPYGFLAGVEAVDRIELQALANEIGSSICKHNSTHFYDVMPSWQLYPVSGSADDWIHRNTGAFAFTVEMATEFIPNASMIQSILDENLKGAIQLIRRGEKKILKGQVFDSETMEALAARISIDAYELHPFAPLPNYAHPEDGSYFRLLPSGTHQVSYSMPGYQTAHRSINIYEDGQTLEDVFLQPLQSLEMNIRITNLSSEGLWGAKLVFEHEPDVTYTTDSQGYIHIKDFPAGTYVYTASCGGYGSIYQSQDFVSRNMVIRLSNNPVFSDDFELSLDSWNVTGAWGLDTSHSYEGIKSLADSPSSNYAPNIDHYCKLRDSIDLSTAQNASLQFWIKQQMAQDGDYCVLEYSTDAVNWQYLDVFDTIDNWQLKDYSLNAFLGQSLSLRFRIKTNDNYTVSDGVYIDNFKVFVDREFSSNDEVAPQLFSLKMGPNPFYDQLYIWGLDGKQSHIELKLYNIKGQKLWQKKHYNLGSSQRITLDLKSLKLSSGLYFLRINQDDKQPITRKLLKLK